MHLTTLDWVIVVVSLGITFVPAIVLARRAGKNTSEFFAAGRQAPWWLIGISLVATTFSTDTPNLVTNFVRTGGVAANWQWWAFLLTGMATVFFFARLWRRSGVLTDLQLYELRYSGKAATFLRGFRSIYLGLFFNVMIIGSVSLAAAKIAGILFDIPAWIALGVAGIVVIIFAATAGLWGVMVTDAIQFCITMSSAFAAAYYALRSPQLARMGGLQGLVSHIGATHPSLLSVLPDFSNWGVALSIFIIPITVQWWSVWYPGAEPGGGSYVAQRMLSARRETDSVWGTLLFQAAHYALRPWPWIIVALASTIVYPTLGDIQKAFPNVSHNLIGDDIAYPAMLVFLPAGWAGFMTAGLFAAYRSTLESHINWGTSYLVHDFYRRFLKPDGDEKHYVMMGRIVTALIMIVAYLWALTLINLNGTAQNVFNLILDVGAGTGLVYILRWYWSRINAWTEVSAMAASFLISVAFFVADVNGMHAASYVQLLWTVAFSTIVWVTVTFITPPVDADQLATFYAKVRPAGPGWERERIATGLGPSPDSLPHSFLGWILGLLCVYAALFGTGAFLYGHALAGAIYAMVFLGSLAWLVRLTSYVWDGQEPAAH